MWSPILKSNIALGYVNKNYMNLGSIVFAEIYHPEELDYRKIWAKCKVVKNNSSIQKEETLYLLIYRKNYEK